MTYVLRWLPVKRLLEGPKSVHYVSDLVLMPSLHRYYSTSNPATHKTALVLGSSGCLGRHVAQHLSNKLNMRVIGADVGELPTDTDSTLNGFVSIPSLSGKPSLADMTTSLLQGVSSLLDDGDEIDAIICASGGFEVDPNPPNRGASVESDVLLGAKAYGDTVDRMIAANLYPVLSAGFIAQRFMGNDGLFVVIGATAALSSTPGMLGYGLSKAAAHHFVHTLGDSTGKSATNPATRKAAKRLQKHNEYLDALSVIGILPTTIDTPANRVAMPDSDFDTWTKPNDIAKEIGVRSAVAAV